MARFGLSLLSNEDRCKLNDATRLDPMAQREKPVALFIVALLWEGRSIVRQNRYKARKPLARPVRRSRRCIVILFAAHYQPAVTLNCADRLAAPFRAHAITTFCAWGIFLASLCSPVDLAVPGLAYPGLLQGNPRSGVRLVRVVVGMPAHTALVKRYGEYYGAGCSGYWLFQPVWVLAFQ